MKLFNHIFTFFIVSIFTLTTAFGQSGNVTVASDKSLTADFEKFETYDFATQINDEAIQVFFLDNLLTKKKVKEAVKYELEARGYNHNADNPDLLVNFRILDEATEFTGYTGVYRDENYWTSAEMRKDAIGLVPDAEIRSAENKETYQLKKGSLMVHLVDNNTGEVVWQGYASGIMNGEIIDGEKDRIQEAISLIFQTYQWRGDEYAVNN